MAAAIVMLGFGAGVTLAVLAWMVTASLLLTIIAYPLGGMLGCLLAGTAIALCRARAESATAKQR
jgi:hypothetical protein